MAQHPDEGDLKETVKEACPEIHPQPDKPWWKRVQKGVGHEYDIVRGTRERAPANYSMKIESFSSVHEKLFKERNVESSEFKAGGHKWVLSVLCCGNKNENGDSHISFNLKVVDKLNSGMVIYAKYMFFVYDHIQDIYLTFQDPSERCFHALKTEWGIAKALELSTFSDPSNGLLVNDSCIFGVEVYVMDNAYAAGTLSRKKLHSRPSFTWHIEKFSKLKNISLSPVFSIAGHSWKLRLYPEGIKDSGGESIGLYLLLVDDGSVSHGSKVYLNFESRIKNQSGGKDHCHGTTTLFDAFTAGIAWGRDKFMLLRDLQDSRKGFKVKDKVEIEVYINEIFSMIAI